MQPPASGHASPAFRKLTVFSVLFILAVLSTGVALGFAIRATIEPKARDPLGLARDVVQCQEPTETFNRTDDQELLWRASGGSALRPPNVPRQVAFLFLTRGPLPLAPLWARFFNGHDGLFSVYIHASPDFPNDDANLPPVFRGRRIPSKAVVWGEISIVDAERRLLAHALLDIFNERFVLVSESCIPILGFKNVYDYLMASSGSFIQVVNDLGPFGKGRWNGNFLPEVTWDDWKKGHQWFELHRSVAMVVVADTLLIRKFDLFCKPHCYSDEHYIPTLLHLVVPQKLANRSVTWVDWSRGGFHPATFGADGVTPNLIQDMRSNERCRLPQGGEGTCYLFARKFVADALDNLMALGEDVLGY